MRKTFRDAINDLECAEFVVVDASDIDGTVFVFVDDADIVPCYTTVRSPIDKCSALRSTFVIGNAVSAMCIDR